MRTSTGLLRRVDRTRVISGMGERPAVVHLRDFGLAGFTTGSGCVAPALCSRLFAACGERGLDRRPRRCARHFMPLEDLRDAWGPARVLHHATELAGIAPARADSAVSSLRWRRASSTQLAPVARALRERDA